MAALPSDWHTAGTQRGPEKETTAIELSVNVLRINNLPNDPGGSRTHDLRIKSPLLYQLSYRVRNTETSHCQTTWTTCTNTALLRSSAGFCPNCAHRDWKHA